MNVEPTFAKATAGTASNIEPAFAKATAGQASNDKSATGSSRKIIQVKAE